MTKPLLLLALILPAILGAQSSHDPDPAHVDHKVAPPTLPPLIAHPVVALTFDDLPAAGTLPAGDTRTGVAARLAAELSANHLEGTYGFINASKLENNPDAQQALRA